MNDYVIYTDSACDIGGDILKSWGVGCISLTFHFNGEEKEYNNEDMSAQEFYAHMRRGATGKTAAPNMEIFKDAFRAELSRGRDVLYLGFSSGLSNTYNAGRLAAEELHDEFPDNRVIAVDTLCASAGQGLMVSLACDKKNEGESIEDVAHFVMENRAKVCHWFTVDDLQYLKRGGRVSPTAAFVGGLLNIKPVLHVDDEGKLIPVSKVRGRKAALTALADSFKKTAADMNGRVFISHGDCTEDAEILKALIEDAGGRVSLISDIGPVVGTHSGPGTLALFFVAEKR